jgi:hypothetical protein
MLENYSKEPQGKTDLWFYGTVILAALLIIAASIYALNYFDVISFSGSSSQKVKTETPKASLSSKNREPAKSALNAIGEINSVASVGANYMQFTNSIQSAKIKFDVAMRDFEAQTPEDAEIQRQLAEVLICYVDAKEAWGEFIEDGDEFGFLTPKSYSDIPKFAATYGFTKSSNGEYFKDTVLGAILREADRKFENVRGKIK